MNVYVFERTAIVIATAGNKTSEQHWAKIEKQMYETHRETRPSRRTIRANSKTTAPDDVRRNSNGIFNVGFFFGRPVSTVESPVITRSRSRARRKWCARPRGSPFFDARRREGRRRRTIASCRLNKRKRTAHDTRVVPVCCGTGVEHIRPNLSTTATIRKTSTAVAVPSAEDGDHMSSSSSPPPSTLSTRARHG